MKEFTIDASPMTLWKVRVVIHDTHANMMRKRRSYPGAKSAGSCAAFCRTHGEKEIFTTGGILAECHYHKRGLTRGVVVHECTHAALNFLWICKLDCNTERGEEAFADSVEHLVEGTMWGANNLKVNQKKK